MINLLEINDNGAGECSVKIDGIEMAEKISSYKIERNVDEVCEIVVTMPVKNCKITCLGDCIKKYQD